uniref:Uncharacterized protein n=1 Tax=Amphimedon queenslandica TaxID=400682 RepID=A0A1X7ULG6_AMPQE
MSLIGCCKCSLKWFFYCLSFVAFQCVPDVKTPDVKTPDVKTMTHCRKVGCSIFFTIYMWICTIILGLAINLFPTVLLIMDWSLCPINYYNICYTLEFHSSDPKSSKVPIIVLRSEDDDGDYLDREDTRTAVQPFNDLAKFTLLSICFSTFVSYFIFIIALIRHYYCNYIYCSKCRCDYQRLANEDNESGDNASESGDNASESGDNASELGDNASIKPVPYPFDNDDDNFFITIDETEAHTTCCCKKRPTNFFYFYLFLLTNLVFWLAMVILFCITQYGIHKEVKEIGRNITEISKILEITSAAAYFYSHFCTMMSCFIFSKIMYGIQKKIKEQKNESEKIIIPNNNDGESISDSVKLQKLIKADEIFLECATKALSCFQFWFFIHWIFYIITSFLTIALSIEALLLIIRATQHHIQPGVHFSDAEMCLLAILSFSNVLMFIYPCFQAASITRARKKYIRDLTKKYAKTDKKEIVDSYVKYLQSREFGFRLYVGCTHIPFNLNVAYTSILIGAFGIVL